MDLRTAVTWKTEVEAALERLVGAVRPAPKPTRAQRTARDEPRAERAAELRRCSRRAR